MSAPGYMYSDSHIATNNGIILLAISDISLSSDARVMSMFALDGVMHLKSHDGNDVFVGLIKDGTGNALRHSDHQNSELRIQKDGSEFIVLNDAGLNVKGYADVDIPSVAFTNYCILDIAVNSAPLSSSDAWGVYISSPSMSEFQYVLGRHLSADTALREKYALSVSGLKENERVTVVPYVTNDVGTYRGRPIEFTVKTEVAFLSLIKTRKEDVSMSPVPGTEFIVPVSPDMWSRHLGFEDLFSIPEKTAELGGIKTLLNLTGAPPGKAGEELFTQPLPAGWYYGCPTQFKGTNVKAILLDALSSPEGYITPRPAGSWSIITEVRKDVNGMTATENAYKIIIRTKGIAPGGDTRLSGRLFKNISVQQQPLWLRVKEFSTSLGQDIFFTFPKQEDPIMGREVKFEIFNSSRPFDSQENIITKIS